MTHIRLDGIAQADVAAVPVDISSIVGDMENREIIAWTDCGNPRPTTDEERFDMGCRINLVSGGVTISETGSKFGLDTSSTTNSEADILARGGQGDRNPHFACQLISSAGGANMEVQGWGFVPSEAATQWDTTTFNKAMFRSTTTGNLFAVTGNASTEETTDLGASHTLGNRDHFEVRSTDAGVTWEFLINGVVVATHTTTVPVVSTALFAGIGIRNQDTTSFQITDIDYMVADQDREAA